MGALVASYLSLVRGAFSARLTAIVRLIGLDE
jgi:hypothetical protein